MRRIFAFLLTVAVMLSFASCGNEAKKTARNTSAVSGEPSSPSSGYDVPSFIDDPVDDRFNLALLGKATADSLSAEYPTYTAQNLNDGDLLTRWLSGKAGTAEEPSVFGVTWETEQTFDILVLTWDASHPAEGGFSVAVADEAATYRVVRRNASQDDGQVDVVLFDTPVCSAWVTVTCTVPYYSETYQAVKDHPSCYELQVYNSDDVNAEDLTSEDITR